jgi:hypothetical protein
MDMKGFEQRARKEVERIKALEAEEAEREQARMERLAEEARQRREAAAAEEAARQQERNAKLIHAQGKRAAAEERMAKQQAWLSWKAQGGEESAFGEAWPSMWQEMLKNRIIHADQEARETQRFSSISRI